MVLGVILLCGTVTAQTDQDQPAAAITESTSDSHAEADSLQHIIDSLQAKMTSMSLLIGSQQLELERLRNEADSLRKYGNCDMSYVLNYGNALLYRKYTARAEDIAILLANAPDSLRQKDWDLMLAQAKKMIQSSNVSQDMRNRVFHMLESVPQDEQSANDIREVLSRVPDDIQAEYSLTHQAISLIDAMPKSITEKDDRYAIVRELLVEYPAANNEVKNTLQAIQEHPDNSINISDKWPVFVKQIKSMQYYKQYYGSSWNIPYLNNIIDQALSRLQNATSHVDLDDLVKRL